MTLTRSLAVIGVLFAAAGLAVGDWIPDDGHKMHFPQPPDSDGWDVEVSHYDPVGAVSPVVALADDFRCSETGPIEAIHFWGSWFNDTFLTSSPTQGISNIHLEIRADVPAGSSQAFSMPLGGLNPYQEPLWQYDTGTGFTVAEVFPPSSQGWMLPGYYGSSYLSGNHQRYFQYNIDIPPDAAFEQQEGTIYWLVIQAETEDSGIHFGWKTADLFAYPRDDPNYGSNYQDAAVSWDNTYKKNWFALKDRDGSAMDLAFVIAPEPASLTVLILGGAVLVVRRRRRR